MKAFQICGYSASGKTTTAEALIGQLSAGQIKVASIKHIHREGFSMDTPGTNTFRHARAGANPVVALHARETDFLFQGEMGIPEVVRHIEGEWLVVEGCKSFPLPKIVCGKDEGEVDDLIDRRTFAIAGVFSERHRQYRGLPVYNPLDAGDVLALTQRVREVVFPMLPYVEADCCGLCGLDCARFVEAVIQKEKSYADCRISEGSVTLKVNGREISMVPFVRRLLKNAVVGVVSELAGYHQGAALQIEIGE